MMDAASRSILTDTIRREGRTLQSYVSESFPWTTPAEQQALERLKQVVEEERQAVGNLIRFLLKNHIAPPTLGVYPGSYTTINFVSLAHLTPLLVENQRRAVGTLEQELTRVCDLEARDQIKRLLEMKRRHLQTLEHLHEPAPQTAAATGVPQH